MSSPDRRHRSGRPWRRARIEMFAAYGCPRCEQETRGQRPTEPHMHVCAICGHLGATEADHITPLAVQPDQPVSADLIRPAHGTSRRCGQCPPGRNGLPRACNQQRGAAIERHQPLITSRDW